MQAIVHQCFKDVFGMTFGKALPRAQTKEDDQ
jgi:hypothetical protein